MFSMEARNNNRILGNHFLRGAMEMVLGRKIIKNCCCRLSAPLDSRGSAPIVDLLVIVVSAETEEETTKKQEKLCYLRAACMQGTFSI